MKHFVKYILLSVLLLTLFALASCRADSTEASTLWVVTEKSNSDGMNLQAQMVAQRMEAEHPGLAVQLDILPTEEESRELALQQLRTQILAGRGPDVYLLPTGNVLTVDDPVRGTKISIEPLFSDVNQSMRQGVFLDIEGYYSTDIALDQGALKAEVMDAGVWAGGRYVLPLRFEAPIVFVRTQELPDLKEAIPNVSSLLKAALQLENGGMAAYGLQLPNDLSLLPRTFDYEQEKMLLSEEVLAHYMVLYQMWKTAAVPAERAHYLQWVDLIKEDLSRSGDLRIFDLFNFSPEYDFFNEIGYYAWFGAFWIQAGFPIYTAGLSDALDTLAITQDISESIEVFPLYGIDGTWNARVVYYGAVGSSCSDPALSYAFLREFLTEEFQWDQYRPRSKKSASVWALEKNPQISGMVENSWPVRTQGSVPYLWKNRQFQFWETKRDALTATTVRRLSDPEFTLTDEDLPALAWPIDRVSFPITLEEEMSLSHALAQLNEEDGSPTEADIDALASDVWHGLQWHLAEG